MAVGGVCQRSCVWGSPSIPRLADRIRCSARPLLGFGLWAVTAIHERRKEFSLPGDWASLHHGHINHAHTATSRVALHSAHAQGKGGCLVDNCRGTIKNIEGYCSKHSNGSCIAQGCMTVVSQPGVCGLHAAVRAPHTPRVYSLEPRGRNQTVRALLLPEGGTRTVLPHTPRERGRTYYSLS